MFGNLPGVVQAATDANGNVVIDTAGIYELSVKGINHAGNAAVLAGDILYFVSANTPPLGEDSTSGLRFGIAYAAAGTTAAPAVGTSLVASGATTTIQVRVG
jgi:hypothetical protein